MVDHGEKFPPEGPGHFSAYLDNIKANAAKSPGPTIEPILWSSVHQFGEELSRFASEGKVTQQEAEGFRQQMASFMSEGANRAKYESYLKEKATFWWEVKPEEKTPIKTP
jgi:hypothetical protein